MKTTGANFILTILLTATLAFCANASSLSKSIDAVISRSSQKNVKFGINIIEAGNGRYVYSRNASESMIPASNMKVITTASALHYLGPDFVYQTKVALQGNTLVIIGSGDPLLGDQINDSKKGRQKGWLLKDITKTLKQADVNCVNDIVMDTTVFDDERVHPSWPIDQLNKRYACEVSGANYNENCIDITCVKRSGVVEVIVEPQTGYIQTINKVRPITSGREGVGAYRTEVMNRLLVSGKCKDKEGLKVAIERPAAFFAYLLAEELNRSGIKVKGSIYEKQSPDLSELKLLKIYKTPIVDCITRANRDSHGLATEALGKTIAAHNNGGVSGNWPDAANLMSNYLTKLGISRNRFNIDDCSGLSRKNLLSPDTLTTVLMAMRKSSNWPLFRDSLAVGGVRGVVISRYFREPKYKGKVIGKTGSINSVKSFSGYCTVNGKEYIFSILTYKANLNTRVAINDIVKAIIDNAK